MISLSRQVLKFVHAQVRFFVVDFFQVQSVSFVSQAAKRLRPQKKGRILVSRGWILIFRFLSSKSLHLIQVYHI